MEKFRNESDSKSRGRLLSVFFIVNLAAALAAQSRSADNFYDFYEANDNFEKGDLFFEFSADENQNFFADEDLDFYLQIPKIKPSQIEFKSHNVPQNARLKTLKKTENYENGGTTIFLQLNFKDAGVYEFENFVFSLKNRGENFEINAKIPKIAIKKDILKESPKIVIIFENGKTIFFDNNADFFSQSQFWEKSEKKEPIFKINEGEKLNFTVCAQFAKKILNFKCEIPKNAIFTQTEFFDYKNYENHYENQIRENWTDRKNRKSREIWENNENRENQKIRQNNGIFEEKFSNDFLSSGELQPLGRFELTGLASGIEEFPEFLLLAENFQEKNEEIKFRGFFIEFLKSGKGEKVAEKNIYDEIFARPDETENQIRNEIEKKELTYDECKKIALKLQNNHIKNTVFVFLPIFAFFWAAFFTILKKTRSKKAIVAIFSAIFLILAFAFLFFCSKNKSGVFLGGKIYAIPNENSTAQNEYSAGVKIKLLEKTEKWLFVQIEENSGWCKTENAIIENSLRKSK